MKVFLVIDCENAPGRVLHVFAHQTEAERFVDWHETECYIDEREVQHGQPISKTLERSK